MLALIILCEAAEEIPGAPPQLKPMIACFPAKIARANAMIANTKESVPATEVFIFISKIMNANSSNAPQISITFHNASYGLFDIEKKGNCLARVDKGAIMRI